MNGNFYLILLMIITIVVQYFGLIKNDTAYIAQLILVTSLINRDTTR